MCCITHPNVVIIWLKWLRFSIIAQRFTHLHYCSTLLRTFTSTVDQLLLPSVCSLQQFFLCAYVNKALIPETKHDRQRQTTGTEKGTVRPYGDYTSFILTYETSQIPLSETSPFFALSETNTNTIIHTQRLMVEQRDEGAVEGIDSTD